MKYISARSALIILIILLSLFAVFHVLVITAVIPCNIVWGGQLNTQEEMVKMESFSILVNLVMLCTAIIRLKYFKDKRPPILMLVLFWLMFILFSLNTVGNLTAESTFEKAIFAPVTLVLALMSLRLTKRS